MVDPNLLKFTKDLLGFSGDDIDDVITQLIMSAEQYIDNAGFKKPAPGETDYAQKISLYNTAVAIRVKILYDGDMRGDLGAVLTGIVVQGR